MTLREAAQRASRSVTTLRRHIRGGRLPAEKRPGRFGAEYFVTEQGLADAGLPAGPPVERHSPPAPRSDAGRAPRHRADTIPDVLYRELQMKHEQLLVQYGMLRAAGLRAVELRAELDETRHRLEEAQARAAELRRRLADETTRLAQRLRRAELEQESRQIEIEALREKIRSLEMLTRNAATSDSIERQFSEIMAQSRRVRELAGGDHAAAPGPRENPLDH